ncbi:MAG: hypothetical protein IPM60_08200 [Rhodospirillales bacterium]|nr:hypothetical protein [Rhodospirillales bacterium]
MRTRTRGVARKNWFGAPLNWLLFVLLPLVLALPGCDQEPEPPSLEIIGGGFIFNYRLAEAYWGITARTLGGVPEEAVLEARFENPGGGEAIVVRQPTRRGRDRYKFETPPLASVEAERDYGVELRLLDPATEAVIATAGRQFRSQIGSDVLPPRPLTFGPGYHNAPANAGPPPPQPGDAPPPR